MSYLIVLSFDEEKGAEEVREDMLKLQRQHIVTLEDAAVVIRRQDGKVKVKQAHSLVGEGALGGAFWGLLIGLIFWMPWLGMAVGAVGGAISGSFIDIGVDDDFIKEVGNTVQPGNSALFLLVREATMDKMVDALQHHGAKIMHTSLSREQEEKLRAAFAADEIKA